VVYVMTIQSLKGFPLSLSAHTSCPR
jgi:hypothetical protein